MPRGGQRANSGRKGLSLEEKLESNAMVEQIVEMDLPRRFERAFAKSARTSHREGKATPEVEELNEHYAEIQLPPREVWTGMKPDERAALLADRHAYSALYSASPTATPIGAMFAATKIPRAIKVPPPTDIELGAIYRAVADAMTARLGRPISSRQVAEARRFVRKLFRV